jgi:hypothetical protein
MTISCAGLKDLEVNGAIRRDISSSQGEPLLVPVVLSCFSSFLVSNIIHTALYLWNTAATVATCLRKWGTDPNLGRFSFEVHRGRETNDTEAKL